MFVMDSFVMFVQWKVYIVMDENGQQILSITLSTTFIQLCII